MLLVYQDVTLKWAAQLSCSPVAVRLANFPLVHPPLVTMAPAAAVFGVLVLP